MILTADWHLTDVPSDHYRWDVFAALHQLIQEGEREIVVLGDIADRKDKHSGALLTRLVQSLEGLTQAGARIEIVMGNHDMPLHGPPFWGVLDHLAASVRFYQQATSVEDRLYLPYTPQPSIDWKGLMGSDIAVAFMHQTVQGAVSGAHVLGDRRSVPVFPQHMRVYSGDVHTPQTVRGVTYVGAPHPVKFGDDYECRLLTLDAHYDIADEVILEPVRKRILDISSLDDLRKHTVAVGDQVRLRCKLPSAKAEQWALDQPALTEWAKRVGVSVASVEVTVLSDTEGGGPGVLLSEPLDALLGWCATEGIDSNLVSTGRSLLAEESEGSP